MLESRKLTAAAVLALASSALAQDNRQQPAATPPAGSPAPTRPQADDGRAQHAAALARARAKHKRLLVVFGTAGNDRCQAFAALCKDDAKIARQLRDEYEVVKLDVGQMDQNLELARTHGLDLQAEGLPALAIAGGDGKTLVASGTKALQTNDRYDAARVLGFLEQWQAEPLNAITVYQDALTAAAKSGKRVLVHLGAPW